MPLRCAPGQNVTLSVGPILVTCLDPSGVVPVDPSHVIASVSAQPRDRAQGYDIAPGQPDAERQRFPNRQRRYHSGEEDQRPNQAPDRTSKSRQTLSHDALPFSGFCWPVSLSLGLLNTPRSSVLNVRVFFVICLMLKNLVEIAAVDHFPTLAAPDKMHFIFGLGLVEPLVAHIFLHLMYDFGFADALPFLPL